MEGLRLNTKIWYMYMVPKAIFRLCFLLLNNLYCIPTYVVWMLLLLPLKKLNPDIYWRIEGIFFHWLAAIVTMWIWSAGYDIVEMGDDISKCIDEKCLLLINHQSKADGLLLMSCFNAKRDIIPNSYWIISELLKYNNFGLILQLHRNFFISAGRDNREKSLKELAQHLTDSYMRLKRRWIALFPEGALLWERKVTSQRFAEKNQLPILDHLLLPRSGAFQVILRTIGQHALTNRNNAGELEVNQSVGIKYILDITIAYPNGEPVDLSAILFGHKPPCTTIFFYRLYNCMELSQDPETMTNWLYKRFEEKELILDTFYKTGKIPVEKYCPNSIPPRLVLQNCLRYLVLHIFFMTSTYVQYRMLVAIWGCLV